MSKMSKRFRFLIVLAVLALCFYCLWPSISWYVRTPKEMQQLALSSLEHIKDYSLAMAHEDVSELKELARTDMDGVLPEKFQPFIKSAKKNRKDLGQEIPAQWTVGEFIKSFPSEYELQSEIEGSYRDEILKAKNYYTNSAKLGLDLSGGMSIVVKADLEAAALAQKEAATGQSDAEFRSLAMEQAIENLSERVDKFGLSEPVIRKQGEDRIYIEIPGAAQADRISSMIMGKGLLNFRLVDSDATKKFADYYNNNPSTTFNSEGELIDTSVIPEDCEALGYYVKDEYGLDERSGYLVVKKEIALDGKHIKSAEVGSDRNGKPQVNFILDMEGAEIFADFTSANVGKNLAIVSDDKIKSNATIRTAITGGQVAIDGFSLDEAQNLQKVLQTAWLNVPLSIESQQVIGASLGEQAISQGIRAIEFGLLAVMIFMLLWYHGAGVNAVVAQVLNLYIMFSILSAFNLTLTLPSIAGMILTIGMAVDANVIIFERIKEELRLGKDRASAIYASFKNAHWTIMDSNITTFIAAMFLVQLGSGPIQGFAVSLAIGVLSSVFTALFVSHLMFDFNTDVLKRNKMSIGWGIKQ